MIVAFYRHCQPAGKLAKNYLYAVWVVDTLPVYKEETTDVYYDEDTPHLVDVTFYHGGSAPEGIRMVLPHRHPGRAIDITHFFKEVSKKTGHSPEYYLCGRLHSVTEALKPFEQLVRENWQLLELYGRAHTCRDRSHCGEMARRSHQAAVAFTPAVVEALDNKIDRLVERSSFYKMYEEGVDVNRRSAEAVRETLRSFNAKLREEIEAALGVDPDVLDACYDLLNVKEVQD